MAHDLVIRGGLIVDGIGSPSQPGDVAVTDGRPRHDHRDHPPELVHDLPDGGPRLVQRANGIAWSFVNGAPVIREGRAPGVPDGRAPGRVLRGR